MSQQKRFSKLCFTVVGKGVVYGVLFWVWVNLFAQVYLGIQEMMGIAIQ